MQIRVRIIVLVLAILFLRYDALLAQEQDVPGSRDHPLISRFKGSIILDYAFREFDELVLPLGKRTLEVPREDITSVLAKSKRLEGKVTRMLYKAPKGPSTLEVIRSYEMALQKARFVIHFSCATESCGGYFDRLFPQIMKHNLYNSRDERFLAAELSRPQGDVYVSVLVLEDTKENVFVKQDIVEVVGFEGGKVSVMSAETMAQNIAKTGGVALYSIHFDKDKSEIKPGSESTLQEIAYLLQQNQQLNLHVVGHTDNVGSLNYNMTLSQSRAEAVVRALVPAYRVDAKRLTAKGVGPLAPVASNDTEEGRARNRRVELVRQ